MYATAKPIITYFKLRENQNQIAINKRCELIITYFKLRENQNQANNIGDK